MPVSPSMRALLYCFRQKIFFKQALKKELADASKMLETIIAVSASNQEEVDKMVESALANGGTDPADPIDDDFMYDRGFYDLDGHLWRINCLK